MRVRYGNLKIPGDDLSPWRVMALVAQPKQVALFNSSRTNSKVYSDSEKMRYTQSKTASTHKKLNVWDVLITISCISC